MTAIVAALRAIEAGAPEALRVAGDALAQALAVLMTMGGERRASGGER